MVVEFRKYEKVHRLGKDETAGILDPALPPVPCTIYVQEKIDGANTSIWIDDAKWIHGASRSRDLKGDDFNGFTPYIQQHSGIRTLLELYPHYILYGEWLVKHTISYKETAYKKWYMFDIFNTESGEYLDTQTVYDLAELHNIEVPKLFSVENPPFDLEKIKKFVGETILGDKGEGIVIKRTGFKNQFGDFVYAKIVTESFKEDNAVTFGGNNRFSDTYEEVYIINKWMTLARVKKVMNKLQPEINERLSEKHIPRICETAYHDLMTEEAWAIAKRNKPVDFMVLKRIAYKKAKQIYMDILNDSISVADIVG